MKASIQKIVLLSLFLWISNSTQAQIEYIGAGNNSGVTISTSSESKGTVAENSLNGSGMDVEMMAASRFLGQATLGHHMDQVERVAAIGAEAWIDEQMSLDLEAFTPRMYEIWEELFAWQVDYGIMEYQQQNPGAPITDDVLEKIEDDIYGPWALTFHYTWWEKALSGDDMLRQKMAYALSQIFVVSIESDLVDFAESLTTFYDIFMGDAFGNYKDILRSVTLSPAMGLYLSHYNNPREIPEENLHPDENYAREIMQLFSIGLYELNQDGTRKKDSEGRDIPTYNNNDIKELAKVFTGLGGTGVMPNPWIDDPYFGMDWYLDDKVTPMSMYEEWHEKSTKTILGELIIPANQPGMQDVDMALDFLFNHDNVGPFVSRQLIQRFVKSNPSPAYISRVAGVFNNNGSGVRGDLGAVIKAILLDPEARDCTESASPDNGKLIEPMLRHVHLGRAIPLSCYKDSTYVVNGDTLTETACTVNRLWLNGFDQRNNLRQSPLGAPSVFNFYLPDHQPVGELTQRGLVAPEFKIHDASTAINYINMMFVATVWDYYGGPWNRDINQDLGWLSPNTTLLEGMLEDPEAVFNYLDIVLMQGRMTDDLRNELRTFVAEQPNWVSDSRKVRGVLFLMMISPEYTILK